MTVEKRSRKETRSNEEGDQNTFTKQLPLPGQPTEGPRNSTDCTIKRNRSVS